MYIIKKSSKLENFQNIFPNHTCVYFPNNVFGNNSDDDIIVPMFQWLFGVNGVINALYPPLHLLLVIIIEGNTPVC